ncbi:dynein light intermediate chain [Planoprotostelium fungivorum]|uniref:Dynein light intermediate chain n=1 Tax=Planoprotostelium fungivorum TaxID=1890364 RepID=A0A2P6NNT3_9EUKA|nr:dynein light intermediate chain [Planoprotostelium fungivorum]
MAVDSNTPVIEEEDTSNVNLWEQILTKASRSVADRVESSNAVFLGNRLTGKSTLLAKIQGLDVSNLKKGIALDYGFVDIFASSDDDDPISRMNLWQLEGDKEYADLLTFAMGKNAISRSIVVITLDMSQPWNALDDLQKWLTVLEGHIKSVHQQLTPGAIDELRSNQVSDILVYNEMAAGEEGKANEAKTPMRRTRKTAEELTNAVLPEGVLTENLGVSIVVVCTKTDQMAQLEKEYNYKESHFEFIQQSIRRVCIQYGAALIYSSARKDINCDLLLSYLRHRMYGTEITSKPQLMEKEAIFIPAGADSLTKIKLDFNENQSLTKDFDAPFSSVIPIPKRLQNTDKANLEIPSVAEDDQEFLMKHRETLDKEDVKDREKNKSGFLASLQKIGGQTTEMQATAAATGTSQSAPVTATSTPITSKATSSDRLSAATQQLGGGETKGESENAVLNNFFTSLINRDTRKTPATKSSGPAISCASP